MGEQQIIDFVTELAKNGAGAVSELRWELIRIVILVNLLQVAKGALWFVAYGLLNKILKPLVIVAKEEKSPLRGLLVSAQYLALLSAGMLAVYFGWDSLVTACKVAVAPNIYLLEQAHKLITSHK